MRGFNFWVSGALTMVAVVQAASGHAWLAMLDTALAGLNLYIGTRR
jgi:hypothetical protein